MSGMELTPLGRVISFGVPWLILSLSVSWAAKKFGIERSGWLDTFRPTLLAFVVGFVAGDGALRLIPAANMALAVLTGMVVGGLVLSLRLKAGLKRGMLIAIFASLHTLLVAVFLFALFAAVMFGLQMYV